MYQARKIPNTATGIRCVPAAAPRSTPATPASHSPSRPRMTPIAITAAQTAAMRPSVSTR